MLKRHPAFSALLAVAVILRVLVCVAYRPALLFQSDAYVYMRRAIEMEPSHHRPILYSLFLKPFLAIQSVFAAVTVQHLLVLGLIVLLYVFMRRMEVPALYATLAVAPLALDAYQLDVEHYVLAEALFQVLSASALVVVMWRERPSVPGAAFAGLLLGLSGTTRFLGAALIPFALLYIWRRGTWRHAGALAIAAAVPLLLYAAWFNSHFGSFALTDRDGHFLYGRVSVIVDCGELEVPDYQGVLCDDRPITERENPNFYVFSRESPASAIQVPDGMTRDDVLQAYARSVITQQPFRYIRTVTAGTLHYFSPARSSGRHDNRLDHWRFPLDEDHAQPQAFFVSKYAGSPPPDIDPARFKVQRSIAEGLRWYQSWAYTHGPLLALALVAALAGAFVRRRAGVMPEALTLAVAGLVMLVVPVATVTFDYRFMLLALPLIPPAAAIAVTGRRVTEVTAPQEATE